MNIKLLKPRVLITACATLALGFAALPARAAPRSDQALPPTLRPALYAALAKDAGKAYAVRRNGCASLPEQALTACFDSAGAHFSSAHTLAVTLHLAAWGRPGHMTAAAAVRPVVADNRVGYAYGNASEWWRVLPMGFEQGFTIARRPSGTGELTLALTAGARADTKSGTVSIGRLRYGKLVVTDAGGKLVPAKFESRGKRILIAVNDAAARYPLTVDPLVWLQQEATASDGTANDLFGFSVALDGTTAMIGAVTNYAPGAVYVFNESGGAWAQTQMLTASDGAVLDDFGWSIAVSGTTAVIGAHGTNEYQGAAYVFTESGGVWTQTQKLTASDGAVGDAFGSSVAFDGSTALIGAYDAPIGGNQFQGAAYVFTESGGVWSQAQKLTASDGAAQDYFGTSVALHGTTALVGADGADIGSNGNQGAAYVFTESGGTWTQTQKLTASDGAGADYFGTSVALDGSTALIGAPDATIGGNAYAGAAYIFSESGGVWTQTQKLTASDAAMLSEFGWSAAIAGSYALIGAWGTGSGQPGAAYVFIESGGAWTQAQELAASDGAGDNYFGHSVALAGFTALVGAYGTAVNGNYNQGAAYLYGDANLGLAVSAPQTVARNQTYVSQTIATNDASVASPAVAATVTVPATASFISASSSQGSCSQASGVVTCEFGPIAANGGTVTADVTLKATGGAGTTIDNTASVVNAAPPLTAGAATTITGGGGGGGGCPAGYTEYTGTLAPQQYFLTPVYQAAAGEQTILLGAPADFRLYAGYRRTDNSRWIVRPLPGHYANRYGPAGTYRLGVKAGTAGGAYTLCLRHP